MKIKFNENLTLRTVMKLSLQYNKKFDDKRDRSFHEITYGKMTKKENMFYESETNEWIQDGEYVTFEFIVKSKVSGNKYPVYICLSDITLGYDSPFKSRVGPVNAKPRFSKKTDNIKRKQKIMEGNLKKGHQFQFFFDSMWVFAKNGILYGKNTTNGPPKIRNPKQYIFFSKHEWYIIENVLIPFLKSKRLIEG